MKNKLEKTDESLQKIQNLRDNIQPKLVQINYNKRGKK